MLTDPRLHDAALPEAVLRYVSEVAPLLALRLDAAQRVSDANAFARRLIGDALVGSRLADLLVEFTPAFQIDDADSAGDGQMLTLKTAAGLPESFRFRYFTLPDGWIALGSSDVEGDLRLRNEVLALNRELNDLTRQLHVANAELTELNQLKNRFIGMAAHDLRRPVGVIMTHGELLLDDTGQQLSAENRELLQTCLAAAGGMKRLIDDFLDASAIEAGALRLNRAAVPVADILAGVMKAAQLQSRHKGVLLEADAGGADAGGADGGGDGRRIEVDAGKVQQALLNLVGNAIEHSVAGQRVWLSARWRESELVLTVRDEGAGIAPEDQGRLFKPFARAGTQKTAGERSTGLGLAIARLIAEAHGGRIGVESTPGHGASFCIALPAGSRVVADAAS